MQHAPALEPVVRRPVPDVCAVIPARGGSKGVPRKNLRLLGGEPLVARAVRTVLGTAGVDQVVVSTDDVEIAYAARTVGARVVDRPERLSGDLATSESAIRHALENLAERGAVPGWSSSATGTPRSPTTPMPGVSTGSPLRGT